MLVKKSMLVKNFLYVGEKYVLEKILDFTNIQVFRQHTFFTNMLHQHWNSQQFHDKRVKYTVPKSKIYVKYTVLMENVRS